MPRSALFGNPLSERDRVEYLRDFLAWLYDEKSSDTELLEGLWRWFAGAPNGPLRGKGKTLIEENCRETPRWPLRKFQGELRAALEELYDGIHKQSRTAIPPIHFTLRTRSKDGGPEYFTVRPMLPVSRNRRRWAAMFLFAFLADLNNLHREAMGRCARPACRHLFIRLRTKRRLYCSLRCRNLAVEEGLTTRHAKQSASPRKRGKVKSRERET